jgi:hypothetical protein
VAQSAGRYRSHGGGFQPFNRRVQSFECLHPLTDESARGVQGLSQMLLAAHRAHQSGTGAQDCDRLAVEGEVAGGRDTQSIAFFSTPGTL